MPAEISFETRSRLKWAIYVLIACLLVAAPLSWFFWQRWQQTDGQLQTVSGQLRSLSASQAQLAEGLREAVSQTKAAQDRAHAAEERAGESELVSQEVARQALQAQSDRTLAELQAEGARQRADTAQKALEQIRKARQEELNMMQQALSKVAQAHRTENGIVVDLSNESFQFDFDKAALRPENREILSRLAGILLASHGFRLYVYGHTDDVGTADYNQGLSERRARAVGDYLVQAGIPAEIVTTKGMGKSSPRVKANTPEAREKNRRVEVGIIDTVIQYVGEPSA